MLTSLATGIRWSVKKAVKENFTTHPSSNSMYYIMFTVVMAAPTTLKQYIRDQKFLPKTSLFWGYYVCSLASVAITMCGALLNAVTFIGSNYLACFLSGDDSQPPSKKKKAQSSRGSPSRLCQICKAARLNWNAAQKQTGPRKFHILHQLRLQTPQPDALVWAAHDAQQTKVLCLLPAQRSTKSMQVNFCWHWRLCT